MKRLVAVPRPDPGKDGNSLSGVRAVSGGTIAALGRAANQLFAAVSEPEQISALVGHRPAADELAMNDDLAHLAAEMWAMDWA
jgi:hypothetical protein